MHRAAHQILDGATVFEDSVAVPMTGWSAERIAEDANAHPERRGMRLFLASRHQIAREVTRDVIRDGSADIQVVVLGAGLDTTAYRPDPAPGLRIFEVDHPATGAWKRAHLAREQIAPTVPVEYVGVDFESESVRDALLAAGLDTEKPVVVVWLGVLVYLTNAAVESTIGALGGLSRGGVHLVLDYSEPPDQLTGRAAEMHATRSERVARIGEPWLSSYRPEELRNLLARNGFGIAEDLSTPEWIARFLGLPADKGRWTGGAHLLHAVWQE